MRKLSGFDWVFGIDAHFLQNERFIELQCCYAGRLKGVKEGNKEGESGSRVWNQESAYLSLVILLFSKMSPSLSRRPGIFLLTRLVLLAAVGFLPKFRSGTRNFLHVKELSFLPSSEPSHASSLALIKMSLL